MTWTHRSRLTADDAVFAGQEADAMRASIEESARRITIDEAPPAGWVSLREQAQLVQHLGVGCAGRVSAGFGLCSFGPAGRAVLASANLQSAVEEMNSFAPLLNLRHRLKFHILDQRATISFHALVEDVCVQESLIPVDIAKILRFLADLLLSDETGASLANERVDDLGSQVDLERFFNIAASNNQVSFPRTLVSSSLPSASRTKAAAAKRDCHKLMLTLGEHMLCASVRRILAQRPCGSPSVEEVAKELGMSTRTFRRRLASQGTSFLQILGEVRFELAVCYLEDRRLTTEHIAEKLGYSESANFRAAFRRWTGSSPRHFDLRNLSTRPGRIPALFSAEAVAQV